MQLYAVLCMAIVLGAAIIAVIYLSKPPSFSEFRTAFVSANSVAIFAMYNGTLLGVGGSSTVSCATALIERLRRPSSSINFFVINQTSCTFATYGLGSNNSSTSNATTTTGIGRCINMSKGMPVLYINYSTQNETVIGRGTLYVSGDLMFLRECGIAAQLT